MSQEEWLSPEALRRLCETDESWYFFSRLLQSPWLDNPYDSARVEYICQIYNRGDCLPEKIVLNFADSTEEDVIKASKNYYTLFKRLVDAGHVPYPNLSHLKEAPTLQMLRASRLSARAAALALLAVAKRRGDLRGIVARELWRDMAERVWEKRWEFLDRRIVKKRGF